MAGNSFRLWPADFIRLKAGRKASPGEVLMSLIHLLLLPSLGLVKGGVTEERGDGSTA